MLEDKLNALIKKIKSVRTKKGFSLEYVGQELGLTISAYWKIENGKTKLTVETLFQLSEILETPLLELLEMSNHVFQPTNPERATNYQQKIDNSYQENKEIYEKLIRSQAEEIAILRGMLER